MPNDNPNQAAMTIEQAMKLALQHHQTGRLAEAEQLYRQILACEPNNPEALNLLGVVLSQKGQNQTALELIIRAIEINPQASNYHNNLGQILLSLRRLDEAIGAYSKALQLKPDDPELLNNLGNALNNSGRHEDAISAFNRALQFKSDYATAHYNLGNALRALGQTDATIASYHKALQINPHLLEARINLGNVFKDQGKLDEAIAAYCQAIALNADFSEAHYNLASTLLLKGNCKRGWQEYEWRWKYKQFSSPQRNFPQPQWDGSLLETRTLLVHTEQGLGDALQFIRYLPLATRQGGTIIVECQAPLQRLFRTLPVKCQIVDRGTSLPAFDLHCPLLSLPLVFGTTLDNIPNTVPYLYPDVQDVERWRRRLDNHLPNIRKGKVGLVWSGNLKPDRCRSIKLSSLAPLGQVPGVCFFSLQKGEASIQAKTPPAGMELIDWTAELKDFADTAALIANLDLVITIDTAA
ncbi:MAG TPA: tetratricopeptide repeat protein, partial [Phycisphaerae bacterium]|nr:tetratricopeptide repeat protein [Phycisphaerae bacterium]